MNSRLIISWRLMYNLIKRVMSYFTDWLRGGLIQHYVHTCGSCNTGKTFNTALQAPMRVNITSDRIPTHPGIKVKSGNKSKAVSSHEKSGN